MARAAVHPLVERKTFRNPDEVRTFPKGKIEIVTIGGTDVAKATFQPGWRWSESVKPIVKTNSCEAAHLGYIISGQMHLIADDGTEVSFGPGDAMSAEPGHDAWVVGDEDCVIFDVTSAPVYAKPK